MAARFTDTEIAQLLAEPKPLPDDYQWGLAFRSAAVFEDKESINRRVLARFSDVGEKLFSRLGANRDRIVQYVQECMSG
jgi:hypothetical protein